MTYPVEAIPPDHRLYLRVHQKTVENGEPLPMNFEIPNDGKSTDWAKYRNEHQCRAGHPENPPEQYGVMVGVSGEVAKIETLGVQHSPIYPENQAHTDVLCGLWNAGLKKKDMRVAQNELRVKVARCFTWIVAATDPVVPT